MPGIARQGAKRYRSSCSAPVRSDPLEDLDGVRSEDLGRAMARKRCFRFGFPDVFAGRLRVWQGRHWLIANSVRCGRLDRRARQVLFVVVTLRNIVQQAKARNRFPGAGSILSMLDICG